MSEHVFDQMVRVVLREREQTDDEPRYALELRDPAIECEVAVTAWLRSDRPRWMGAPMWARASGVSNHPVRGLLRAWIRTWSFDLYGVVDVELAAHAHDGRLQLVLPCQLIPVRALRLPTGANADRFRDPDAGATLGRERASGRG